MCIYVENSILWLCQDNDEMKIVNKQTGQKEKRKTNNFQTENVIIQRNSAIPQRNKWQKLEPNI